MDNAPGIPQTPIGLLSEVELLRLTVAQLQVQNAQLQTQQLATARDALIRDLLRGYVSESDLAQYVIDLDTGMIHPREPRPLS